MKDTSGLTFNGQGGDGYSRNNSKSILVNQHTGYMNDGRLVNKGRGPTVGNKSSKKTPGTDTMPSLQTGKDMFMGSSNPQVRTPGGTRSWEPKCEQNYKGDINKMNVGRGPTKGNQL
jgi:hypothetical protein